MIIKPENPSELAELLKSRPLILYGVSDTGRRIAQWCGDYDIPYLWSDKNADLQKNLSSVYVAPQDIVRSYPAANIAITSIAYRDEIMEDLLRLGIESERILQPYIFMPDEVDWRAIEDDGRADWELMRKRFQMIAEWGWIPNNVKSVADYGAGHKFIKALLLNDTDAMNEYMNRVSEEIFSCFDTGKRPSGKAEPERFYHGFVLGLMVELSDRYVITSNRESGFGRYDIMLMPKKKTEAAYLIEFKVHHPKTEDSLADTVHHALDQIKKKDYQTELRKQGIPPEHIFSYGFAFAGKQVLIGS